ncbi:MAG TPA: hypothetical protein VJ749_08050 [Pyrinomonadaceae bacterium]|nr:hypothetical protein [Pyrinomonadaceae bacterium]
MTADEFVNVVRAGSDKLRVDDVVVDTGGNQLRGRGLLRIDREEISIDLTLADPSTAATMPRKRITTKRDWWKLTGVIEDGLPFRCENVSPGGPEASRNGIIIVSRELHAIELAESLAEKEARQKELREKLGWASSDASPDDGSFTYKAILVDFELPAVNGETTTVTRNTYTGESQSWAADTFVGETAQTHYALIRADNRSDLEVYVRSKEDFRSSGTEEDERIFHAILQSLGFLTGIQPWPFRIKHTHGHSLVSDRITAARRLPRTLQSPFNKGLGRSHSDEFAAALRCAAEFLCNRTPFTEKLTHLASMFRAAGDDGVHLDIKILATCALLESLVRTIYAERTLGGEEQEKQFRDARARVVELIEKEAETTPDRVALDRLKAIVADAAPLTIQGVFRAVGEQLGLDWEKQLQPVFTEWKTARNPAAHGRVTTEHPDPDVEAERVKTMFFLYSRIAGGFNMLLLKLFGYTGTYRSSVLEDVYGKL